MKNQNFKGWLEAMNLSHPLVIAGPCSAESEAQVLEIAHQLKNTDATVFRAGIWKPRTRPGSFEGHGVKALPWMQKVKQETGLLTTIEIGNAQHAKLALEYDIDILWIGARTTVNPFVVQEIADALRGTDKIVLIKNPINPDYALWMGAVERFYEAGITKLGVIHRGFSSYEKDKYRNSPKWQIPIDLKHDYPNMPIICDPSHITGRRDLIFEVAQTALDLNFDGLMIETHCHPDEAWSDASQQITPATLAQITKDLRVRKLDSGDLNYIDKLSDYRSQINFLDNQLIELLGQRMQVADKIGTVKKENNVAVLQNKRWGEIIQNMLEKGDKNGLSNNFIDQIFKAIHQESIDRQEMIMKGE